MSFDDLLREAQDPSTSPGRLQELAQADRGTWAAIASNPAAYQGLLDWLGEHGDDSVRAAIAARSTSLTPPPPPAPPAPTTEPPAAAPSSAPPTLPPPSAPPIYAPMPAAPPTAYLPSAYAGPHATGGSKKGPLLAILAVVVVLVIAGGIFAAVKASGGDDDKPTAAKSSSSASAPTTGDASPSAGSSSSSGTSDSGDFCSTMKSIEDSSTDMLGGLPSSDSSDPTSGLKALQDTFSHLSDLYTELAQEAPAELKSDIETVQQFLANASSGSAGTAGLDDRMNDYIAAAKRITAYYYKTCS